MNRSKAKLNKKRIVYILLGLVFAITIGVTYALPAISMIFGSSPASNTAYASGQQYQIVNDTISNPISFSAGSANREVAIVYSYGYDFDIRIQYSLSWSDSALSTDNVILNYADRDSLIVDNEYIYHTEPLTAGSGKLVLFTGVDFIDEEDADYIGQSLTIEIESVEIYKSQSSYSTSNPLYTNTIAGRAWLRYKNSSDYTNASVIVYNMRTTTDNMVAHPGVESAYYKDIVNNQVQTAIWSGGNREYAGLSAYIITGNSPIRVHTTIIGSWERIAETSLAVADNNILYNYSSDWTKLSNVDSTQFETRAYDYVIPANSAVYIELLDSIEITCLGPSDIGNYEFYRIQTVLQINGVEVTDYSDRIAEITISSSTLSSASANYAQSDISIINQSIYDPGLYDIFTSGIQSFDTVVKLTNNTADKIRVNSISFQLVYTYFESNLSSYTLENRRTETASITLTPDNLSSYISAYSSVQILSNFQASLLNLLTNYDAWLEIKIVSIDYDTVTSTTNALSVLTTAEESGNNTVFTFTVKNNSSDLISNITADLLVEQLAPEYTLQESRPSAWIASYWKYYYLSSGEYRQVLDSDYWVAGQSPTTNIYSLRYNNTNISISNATLYNGFTLASGTQYTSSDLVLAPNETAKILSFTFSGKTDNELIFTTSASGASTSANRAVSIVNEGTEYTYIINNSTSAYYIRFTGSIQTTAPNIVTLGGYNYYIGALQPGHMISVSMSASTNISLSTIIASDSYSRNAISSQWGEEIADIFDLYYS